MYVTKKNTTLLSVFTGGPYREKVVVHVDQDYSEKVFEMVADKINCQINVFQDEKPDGSHDYYIFELNKQNFQLTRYRAVVFNIYYNYLIGKGVDKNHIILVNLESKKMST